MINKKALSISKNRKEMFFENFRSPLKAAELNATRNDNFSDT